ncbi:MAG: hypothetical protein IKU51_07770 [Clostridia bacterium]|nr:hypothetical protein [Clostridia bacterium]
MKTNGLNKSKVLLSLVLAAAIALSVCACASGGSITSGSFTGNFREDGSVVIDGNAYLPIDSFPYEFSNSILNRGWIGKKGQKMPQDADANAELVNEVLLLLDDSDTAYCREDHYEQMVSRLNDTLTYESLYFTFLVDFKSSYRYYLSGEQDAALAEILSTVTPVAASTVFTESDGMYRYDGGIPLIARVDDTYFDHMYWSTILYMGEKYYLAKGFEEVTYPRMTEGDTQVYPVPESYNELIGAIFECNGGKVTEDDDNATEDLTATTTSTTSQTSATA